MSDIIIGEGAVCVGAGIRVTKIDVTTESATFINSERNLRKAAEPTENKLRFNASPALSNLKTRFSLKQNKI